MTEAAQRYTDYVFKLLDVRIRDIEARLLKIEQRDKIAETAYAVPMVEALADAPTDLSQPELRWIGDGRKPGEGVGAGTGVLAIFNPATSTWVSCFSGTAVTV